MHKPWWIASAVAVMVGCGGSDDSSQPAATGQDSGVDSSEDASADQSAPDSNPDSGQVGKESGPEAGPDGGEADGQSDAQPEAQIDAPGDAAPFTPTPADIFFEPQNPVPAGERIVFGVWGAHPSLSATDSVYAIAPDGSGALEIFRTFRIWSLGISHAADRIAFACGDPEQEAHYGLTLGDAVQNTWMYDVAVQEASVVASGNVNDECHTFSADDAHLYVCRRYDFTSVPEWKGYTIGRIDLSTLDFEFLTQEGQNQYSLYPRPNADESQMLFGRLQMAGATATWKLMTMSLPGGTPSLVRDNATRVAVSPDGTKMAYLDLDADAVYVSNPDGTEAVQVTGVSGSSLTFSPDGAKLAYLADSNANCSHIEVVATDGSTVGTPDRVLDCTVTGQFITTLGWAVFGN